MKEASATVSIIIRTKNEERFIAHCLNRIYEQSFQNFEIIIVDNESTDLTLKKISTFPISKILTCHDYLPGKALNMGIQSSRGKFIVCLSAHCIPTNKRWLECLLKNFEDEQVAGVYGRQEPLSYSSDWDKRDLMLVFGLDRKVQIKDSFFHNANSMIRKDLWESVPFNDQTPNIEDRLWAAEMIKQNYRIVYEPHASVYHYHGIHQTNNLARCTSVVKILTELQESSNGTSEPLFNMEHLNIFSFIPISGQSQLLENTPLLQYTVKESIDSRYIKRTFVLTDQPDIAKLAKPLGAEIPFLRDPASSKDSVDLGKVFQQCLHHLETQDIFPDIIVCLEVTFPFRPPALIDTMILKHIRGGYDTVVAGYRENRSIWQEQGQAIEQLVNGLTRRHLKPQTFVELRGIGCITYPEFIRTGNIFGPKIGICDISDPMARIEVRSDTDLKLAELILKGRR